MKKAGIRAVLNLADTEDEIAGYFNAEDFVSEDYKTLYEKGNVIALGLLADYADEAYRQGLARGLTFLSEREGPWLVHCNEGRDRSGFTVMVIELLMGATRDEVIADYIGSFANYYGVEPGTDRYDIILENNFIGMMREVVGENVDMDGDDMDSVDLQAAAEQYLLKCGMTQDAIDTLKLRLSGEDALADAA